MKNFELDSKIIWRRSADIGIDQAFYPSFYKDIIKRESFFKENFKVEIANADVEKLKNIFIPLYMEEVASREDFTLNKENIISQITEKITKNNHYKFLFVFDKEEAVTAILFSLKNNGLYLAYKANKKYFDKALSHKATVSYWTEKLIFEYGKECGVDFFSYGKDSNPYFGKTRIGLSLYKIKTGMKPKRPGSNSIFSTVGFDEQAFKDKNDPIIFFENPNGDGFYQNCFLYYPKDSLHESFVNEFEVVSEWAGISFGAIEC